MTAQNGKYAIYKKNYRDRERLFEIRYQTPEAIPGESYTEFKRRLKQTKLIVAVCLAAVAGFQILGALASRLF